MQVPHQERALYLCKEATGVPNDSNFFSVFALIVDLALEGLNAHCAGYHLQHTAEVYIYF